MKYSKRGSVTTYTNVTSCSESDHAAGHVARFHVLEAGVDLFECDRFRYHLVEVQATIHVHLDEPGHVGAELI